MCYLSLCLDTCISKWGRRRGRAAAGEVTGEGGLASGGRGASGEMERCGFAGVPSPASTAGARGKILGLSASRMLTRAVI